VAGALPRTPLGELIALPRPSGWIRGRGGREEERRGRRKEGGNGSEGGVNNLHLAPDR